MAEFNPRQQWLDEYLKRPHLWPGQVEAVLVLAKELDVEVRIERRSLNNWAAGWLSDDGTVGRPARTSGLRAGKDGDDETGY